MNPKMSQQPRATRQALLDEQAVCGQEDVQCQKVTQLVQWVNLKILLLTNWSQCSNFTHRIS